MFKNGHLRLLMKLVGFQRIGVDEEEIGSPWMVPSGLSADQLKQSLDLIKQNEFNPPVFDDGKEAEEFIRRKSAGTAARRRTAYDDDSDNALDSNEEEFLFPAGGPTAMKKSAAALEALKKRRRRRKPGSDDEDDTGLTEEQQKIRAEARRARELEKLRKIKSDLYIHDSDEGSDEERDRVFFEQEEKLRQRTKLAALQLLTGLGKPKESAASTGRKRAAQEISSDSENSDDDPPRARRHSSSSIRDDDLLEGSGNEETDTPLSSSPHIRSSQTKRLKISSDIGRSMSGSDDDEEDDVMPSRTDKSMRDVPTGHDDGDEDEDDVPVVRMTARRRVTSGFVIDSSDEE